MRATVYEGFLRELSKIAAAQPKIKSNDRMVRATRAHVAEMMERLESWDHAHQPEAVSFAKQLSPTALFELLHGIRRWYTGQTMAKKLHHHHADLARVMRLDPKDVVGVFRGFKVPNSSPLADVKPGQHIELDVLRNGGLSSWSTDEKLVNRFSGGGRGHTGINVKLISSEGVKPLLAPPSHTEPWFNSMYERLIGKSFRPTESEYLIAAPKVTVEVVRVKK